MLSVTGVMLRAAGPPCWVRPAVTDRARSGNPNADAFKRRLSIGVVLPYSGYSLGTRPIDWKIMEEIASMLARGAPASTVSGRLLDHTFAGLERPQPTTSTWIALNIRHQPIPKRDESRIVLPKRAVNQIPGLPLGYRQLEVRDQAA